MLINPIGYIEVRLVWDTLHSDNMPRPFQVTCYDWDSDGSHDLIGHFELTMAELETAVSTHG